MEGEKIVFVTSSNTLLENATLHFVAVPSWVVSGMKAYDETIPRAIPPNTT